MLNAEQLEEDRMTSAIEPRCGMKRGTETGDCIAAIVECDAIGTFGTLASGGRKRHFLVTALGCCCVLLAVVLLLTQRAVGRPTAVVLLLTQRAVVAGRTGQQTTGALGRNVGVAREAAAEWVDALGDNGAAQSQFFEARTSRSMLRSAETPPQPPQPPAQVADSPPTAKKPHTNSSAKPNTGAQLPASAPPGPPPPAASARCLGLVKDGQFKGEYCSDAARSMALGQVPDWCKAVKGCTLSYTTSMLSRTLCTGGLTIEHSPTVCKGLIADRCVYSCDTGYAPRVQSGLVPVSHVCEPDGTFVGGSCVKRTPSTPGMVAKSVAGQYWYWDSEKDGQFVRFLAGGTFQSRGCSSGGSWKQDGDSLEIVFCLESSDPSEAGNSTGIISECETAQTCKMVVTLPDGKEIRVGYSPQLPIFMLPLAYKNDEIECRFSDKPPLQLPSDLRTVDSEVKVKWLLYLALVYGHTFTEQQVASVRLDTFDILFSDKLENVGLLMGIAPSIAAPTRVSQCDITGGPRASDYMCPNQPGQAFTCNTPFWDPPNSIFLFRGIGREDPAKVQMLTAALSHTWIEVSHCSFMTLMTPNYPDLSYPEDCKSDPTHVCKSEAMDRYHNQAWLYRTTGSGNYFNVGRTMAFNYHSDAVQHFFKRGCAKEAKYGKRRGMTCVNDLIELADRAQQLGFDTLQFLAHDDMRCGNTLLEVMDVRAGADSRSTCMARKGFEHRSRLFAGGYNASRPCACMETDRCLQCSR